VIALRNFAILALIALAIVALPGGGPTLSIVLTLLSIAFFVLIALFGYRMYHEQHMTLDSLSDRQRFVLYASVGVAFLTFTATPRLFNSGLGVLVWLVLLGLASYGVMWVYISYRRYG
jgi:drug/metabolite transporter (DMT)-like permease